MTAKELWSEYCDKTGIDKDIPHLDWAFCGGGPMADELLELVLEGKKFGTASIYEDYIAYNEEVPGDREYSIILDSNEQAACVIRNFETKIEAFDRVSEYHGYSEGEEERTVAAWSRIHNNYWQPDFERLGIASASDCHAVLEKFTVEYVADGYKAKEGLVSDCFLIEPNIRYADQITEYREKMLAASSSFDGSLSLKRMANPKEFVDYAYEWGNPLREVTENSVRGTLLFCVRKSDDNIVGMIQIFKIPEGHPKYGIGNIGYSVRPDERQKGYASWMLSKALEYYKYGLEGKEVIISCLPENEASKKTIIKNGGVYKDTIFVENDNVNLDRFVVDLTSI